jgi:hypothetical protein
MIVLVSSSDSYAARQDWMVGSFSVVAPDMKDIAVAAGAACAEESINDDYSNRISVSLQRVDSMIAIDVLPGKADSRRSMLDIVLAKSTIKLLFMFQH